MKKLILLNVLLLLLVTFFTVVPASADESQTIFKIVYTKYADGLVDVEIKTDKPQGVGGINMALNFNTKIWSLSAKSAESDLKKSDVSEIPQKGEVRLLWDTTGNDALPETLLKATFKPIGNNADLSKISLNVLEYYDNTSNLNDLPFNIEQNTSESSKQKSNFNSFVWILFVVVLLAVAFYFLVYRLKVIELKKLADRFMTIVKKLVDRFRPKQS